MSYGDEIMASGQARTEAARCGGPVHIRGRSGQVRWSELWQGLDWIARPGEPAKGHVVNGPHCRPYLTYPFTREGGSHFSGWRARDHIGAIALNTTEQTWARGQAPRDPFILVEPEIAPEANPNKQWGRRKWAELVELLKNRHPIVQPLTAGSRPLPGVFGVRCPSFRSAAALLQLAAISILPEGGLHHAAAALGRPAVVLFGGANSPEFTGYSEHRNIADTGLESPCGRWEPCAHCREIWHRLPPEQVYEDALEAIDKRTGRVTTHGV